VIKTLMIATAMMTGAFSSAAAQPSSALLQSLPAEVQKQIEDVRAACREHLVSPDRTDNQDPNQSWMSSTANKMHSVSSGDDGLIRFIVSGAQAVMVSHLELCGGQCLRGANCTPTTGGYSVAIYIRSRNAWKEAFSTSAIGSVFPSINGDSFKALVLNIFTGDKNCPTYDNRGGFWKRPCAVVVKWNGTKFTYKPL
jgi:hypothetical protein